MDIVERSRVYDRIIAIRTADRRSVSFLFCVSVTKHCVIAPPTVKLTVLRFGLLDNLLVDVPRNLDNICGIVLLTEGFIAFSLHAHLPLGFEDFSVPVIPSFIFPLIFVSIDGVRRREVPGIGHSFSCAYTDTIRNI